MEEMDVARRYFAAWNSHDPGAIVATFAEGGTSSDPASGAELTGAAIAANAGALFAAFPDLTFDIASVGLTGDGTIAAEWVMRGTNTGPLRGSPPTGRRVSLPGADFIAVADGKIRSVRGYFDQKAFVEQLGLQVIVQPYAVGPVSFGYATSMQLGKPAKPGAVSLTAIEVRSDAEAQQVVEYSRQIMSEMATMPGFISFLGAVVGRRLYTVTAWEDPESPRQLLRPGGAHHDAMRRFFGRGFARGGQTSVWTPHRVNVLWVRCPACDRMVDAERLGETCQCGQPLPKPPAYW
jgi:steroid delta-isomerase-like uncharacterized protein